MFVSNHILQKSMYTPKNQHSNLKWTNLKMYFLHKMRIFHCQLSLTGGYHSAHSNSPENPSFSPLKRPPWDLDSTTAPGRCLVPPPASSTVEPVLEFDYPAIQQGTGKTFWDCHIWICCVYLVGIRIYWGVLLYMLIWIYIHIIYNLYMCACFESTQRKSTNCMPLCCMLAALVQPVALHD